MKKIFKKFGILYYKLRIWIMDRKIKKARRDLDKSIKENQRLRKELGLPPAWDLKR